MNKSLTPSQQLFEIEVNLRGMYLSVSCDVEFVLSDLICVCLANTFVQKERIRTALFEKIMLDKKIKMAQEVLIEYNTAYYEQFKDIFSKFKELKNYRNLLAHSRIKYGSEVDLTYVVFEFVKDGKNEEQKEYINQLKSKILQIRKSINELLALVVIIYTEKDLRETP